MDGRAVVAGLLGDEREPEPGAGSLRGRLEPPERLEDALAVALRDAVAVVVDGQHGRGVGGERDVDGPVLASVVGGVVGFAAWFRNWSGNEHIHAVAISDPDSPR